MSDDNIPKKHPLKTQPIKKTSAVPLRKETVRVTLKAPGARPGVPVPPAAAPTIPLGGGVKAPTPTAPMTPEASMIPGTEAVSAKVDLPDVTSAVPLKQETMRVTLKADGSGAPSAPAPAPTIPLGGGAAPARSVPAPTIPLGGATPQPVAAEPTVRLGVAGPATTPITQPLQKGGSSQPLPKATVQLQQTQQLTQGLGTPSQVATIQTVVEDDVETRRGSKAALPLSIVAFVLTLLIGFFAIQHAGVWVDKDNDGGGYSKLFE